VKTFVVRIWTDSEPGPRLCGIARHVQSGREARFTGPAELLRFLAAADRPAASEPLAAHATDPGTTTADSGEAVP
jgi:hypothetical protein